MKLRLFLALGLIVAALTFLYTHRSPSQDRLAQTSPTPASGQVAGRAGGTKSLNPTSTPGAATFALGANLAQSPGSNPPINPYAGSLREPGRSKRSWDVGFLAAYQQATQGTAIRFELTNGRTAEGTIGYVERRDGEIIEVAGSLVKPEAGRFSFRRQTLPGKAGAFVGEVELPGSNTAYRIEPTGPSGAPELWERRLDEVLCLTMPPIDEASDTNEPVNLPPLDPQDVTDFVPAYNDGIISLQSLPGAVGVLYIDYRGGYTPDWGGITYERPNVSNAQIKDVWKRVAEDYMPFNVNVTTDIRVYQAAPENSRQRCVCTPTTTAAPGAGGVAYMGDWNRTGDRPCWSFYSTGKAAAEVVSHEVGHTVGLAHDGQNPSTEYYGGQGSGAVGWAPIMGVGYYQPVVQWSKGEYANANQLQDDLSIIVNNNNNIDYRPDDTGATLATARYLELYPGYSAFAEGVIETTGDTDAFRFTTTGGAVTLTANPVGDWANLAIMATLANASDAVIASNNPQTQLAASITTTLAAGTYTFRVTGAGRNNPLTDGFSSYGSLGYYSITGSVAGAVLPTRLSVAEHAPNGSIVGTVPAAVSNAPLAFAITAGNTGNTFAIDTNGVMRVANNTLLDYYRLGTNTQFTVQFELFVNITNLSNPALTELNRRVVIAVLNVNDAPLVTGFSGTVIEHTQIGTAVGTVKVSDPDQFETLTFGFASGNSNGVFAIDANGLITVAADLSAAAQRVYSLGVVAFDDFTGNPKAGTGYVTLTVITNTSPFEPGTISYALYDGIGSGNLVSDLTNNARWPRDPNSELQQATFEGLTDRADSYGAAMRGYLIPPQSGSYTFWIATDDNGELWFSNTTNPASATRIAYISGSGSWASPRQWTKYATQQSAPISLVAGQAYYVEARMKEGNGGDNIAVAWKGPATANLTNVIPCSFLAPYPMNYVPHLAGFSANVRRDAFTGAAVGRLTVSDVNATDTFTFTILSGNTGGLFSVDGAGTVRVTDEAVLQATSFSAYTLSIKVADSGTPSLSATTSVALTLIDSNVISPVAIQREMFYNIGGGTTVTDLTGNPKYPARPDALTALTGFASAVDVADNYGSRVRALVIPPVSGDYRFFIASDDSSQLKFSPTTNPASATVIASVTGWSDPNQWTKFASQTSGIQSNLVAGQAYYLEALQKEGGGGDHVSVGWLIPGTGVTNVIDAAYLAPVDINYPPTLASQSFRVFAAAPNGTYVGTLSALDSPLDIVTFKIIGGNTNNMFSVDPADGDLFLADNTLFADGTLTSVVLTVAAQDSGLGGLYPLKTAQASVTISAAGTNAPFVWTGGAATNAWSAFGNWGGVVPGAGTRLIFGRPARQANVNDLSALSVSWVQMTNSGFNLSGNPLTLQSGVTNSGDNVWGLNTTLGGAQTWLNSSGTLSLNGAITNAGFTWNVVANAPVRLAGPVSGAGALSKSGTATLLMSGTHAYTGATIVAAAGGTTTALEVNGTQDLDISGSDLTLNGRMDLWNHNATVGALNGIGLIFANNGIRVLQVGANGHGGFFSGTLTNSTWASGVALGLVKLGAGTQTLSASNSFTGGTVVSAGTLVLAGVGSVFAGPVTINPGATLSVDTSTAYKTNANPVMGAGTLLLSGVNYFVLRGTNSFSGTLQINGGSLVLDNLNAEDGRAAVNLTSGMLQLGNPFVGNFCTIGSLSGGGAINPSYGFTAGTRTLAVIQSSNTVFSGLMSDGSGGRILAVQKTGPGTLTLNAAHSYSGPTVVSQGTLALGPGGSIAFSKSITLAAGATLDVSAVGAWALGAGKTLQGAGSIVGAATIYGSLLPGTSLGTLTFANDASLAGNTVMEISKLGTTLASDSVACLGLLTYGGTLTVTNIGPDNPALGDAFLLFNAAQFGTNTFASFNLPALPSTLRWDTSTLGADGRLRVVAAEPAVPPTLAAWSAAGRLYLSWPTDYFSFTLQGHTNPLAQGIGTNWYPVPGVTNNTFSTDLDPALGAVFYRLIKP